MGRLHSSLRSEEANSGAGFGEEDGLPKDRRVGDAGQSESRCMSCEYACVMPDVDD